jgi:hypothetical protein
MLIAAFLMLYLSRYAARILQFAVRPAMVADALESPNL